MSRQEIRFRQGSRFWRKRACQQARTSVVIALVALSLPLPLCAAGFDRIELNVPDPPAAARWYANHLGGRLVQLESAPAVAFGKITLSFAKADGLISDSVGSGIDHLGFSYANIDTPCSGSPATACESSRGSRRTARSATPSSTIPGRP